MITRIFITTKELLYSKQVEMIYEVKSLNIFFVGVEENIEGCDGNEISEVVEAMNFRFLCCLM